MVLLKAERTRAALEATNLALEHGEVIAIRLNQSLQLLRDRRDELAAKMRSDTDAAAPPAPPRRVWSYS
jgi:hypothetical protein